MDQQKARSKNQKKNDEFKSLSLSNKEPTWDEASTPFHQQKLFHKKLEKE